MPSAVSETRSGFWDSATTRRAERCAVAALALLMPASLIGLLIVSRPLSAPAPRLSRELIFILPRLVPAPAPSSTRSAPFFAPAPVVPLPPAATAPFAAPLPQMRAAPVAPDLSGIGRALQDCNIDNYGSLSPERRKLCPRPGEGLAIQEAPSLGPVRPQAKDEEHWQEQWDEDHWTPGLCPAGVIVVDCLMDRVIAEKKRAKEANARIAEKKAAALREPKRALPANIGVHP